MATAKRETHQHHRKRYVVTHAIDRLRERAPKRFATRPHGELIDLLDQSVDEAIVKGKWESIIDEGLPRKLIDTREMLGGLYAVVRRNAGNGVEDEAIITVLTAEMVEQNRLSGKWMKRDAEGEAAKFGIARMGELASLPSAPPQAPTPKPVSAPKWISGDDALKLLGLTGRGALYEYAKGWPKMRSGRSFVYDREAVLETARTNAGQYDEAIWVARAEAAKLLGIATLHHVSTLSVKLKWPKRMLGNSRTVVYDRAAVMREVAERKGEKVAAPPPAPTPPPTPTISMTAPPVADSPPSPVAPSSGAIKPRIIRYEHQGSVHFSECTAETLSESVDRLVQRGVAPGAIQMFKPMAARVVVEIDE